MSNILNIQAGLLVIVTWNTIWNKTKSWCIWVGRTQSGTHQPWRWQQWSPRHQRPRKQPSSLSLLRTPQISHNIQSVQITTPRRRLQMRADYLSAYASLKQRHVMINLYVTLLRVYSARDERALVHVLLPLLVRTIRTIIYAHEFISLCREMHFPYLSRSVVNQRLRTSLNGWYSTCMTLILTLRTRQSTTNINTANKSELSYDSQNHLNYFYNGDCVH